CRALGVRRAGCERTGPSAGPGGVWMVRHSDLDRRRSDLRDARGARPGAEKCRMGRASLLRRLLAAELARDRARHSDYPLLAGNYVAVSAADRSGAAALCAREGRRIRADAGDPFEVPDARRVLPLLRSLTDRRSR